MKITCIALDDEPAALKIIENYAALVPFIDLKHTFVSPKEALIYLKSQRIDCVFLDIKMPDILGTDFAKIIENQCQIVFTTAYSTYAVDSYEVQATDFLVKPIEFDKFLRAANRAYAQVSQRYEGKSSVFIKEGLDWVRLDLAQIRYIMAESNYLSIYTHKKLTTRMSMAEILAILPTKDFIRVHKSYIVAMKYVQKIERHQLDLGNVHVPIGRLYQENIAQLFG